MATVYEVKVVSHWINYTKEQIEEKLFRLLKEEEAKVGNSVTVHATKKR